MEYLIDSFMSHQIEYFITFTYFTFATYQMNNKGKCNIVIQFYFILKYEKLVTVYDEKQFHLKSNMTKISFDSNCQQTGDRCNL